MASKPLSAFCVGYSEYPLFCCLPRKPHLLSCTWAAIVFFHVSHCMIWQGTWELSSGNRLPFCNAHWKLQLVSTEILIWRTSQGTQKLAGRKPLSGECPCPLMWSVALIVMVKSQELSSQRSLMFWVSQKCPLRNHACCLPYLLQIRALLWGKSAMKLHLYSHCSF